MKPRLFVGSASSGKALEAARAVQSQLQYDCDVTIWKDRVFAPTLSTLESLVNRLSVSDAGLFVFTAEDTATVNNDEKWTVRDNVLFEFGMFIGHLGRGRSFVLKPRHDSIYIPTNLLGVNYLEYDGSRADRNIVAAVGPACDVIRNQLVPHPIGSDGLPTSSSGPPPSHLSGSVWRKENTAETIVFLDDRTFAHAFRCGEKWSLCSYVYNEHFQGVTLDWSGSGANYRPQCSISEGFKEIREPVDKAVDRVHVWRRAIITIDANE